MEGLILNPKYLSIQCSNLNNRVTTHLYGWGEVRHNFHPDPSLFLDDKFVLIFNKIIQT